MDIKKKIQHALTIFFLKLQDASVEKVTQYKYNNYYKDIYVYVSDTKKNAQALPCGTIVYPKHLFTKYSTDVQDFFFLHELGNLKLNIVFKILIYLCIPCFLLISLSSFLMLISSLLKLLLFKIESNYFYNMFILNAKIFFIFGFFGILLSWIHELHAELFAIEIVGEKTYLKVLEELENKKEDVSIMKRIRHRLLYPPLKLILFFIKS